MIAGTAIIHPNVRLGNGCIVEDFVIIGAPAQGMEDEGFETIIGDNAVIRSHSVIYAGNVIGKNFQTGNKTNIRELNKIGDNVSIGTMSIVEHHVAIGDGVRIHSNVFIPEYTILEDSCWIGPAVTLTNAKYPASIGAKGNLKGPIIRKKAIIGANVTILPGVVIGEEALIGAGSVVVKDISDKMVVVGNPSKVINNIDEIRCYKDSKK